MKYQNDQPAPTTIFEAAALHFSVKVRCGRCPNAAIFEAAGLWWYFERRRWSDEFAEARKHFWCVKCVIGGVPRQLLPPAGAIIVIETLARRG